MHCVAESEKAEKKFRAGPQMGESFLKNWIELTEEYDNEEMAYIDLFAHVNVCCVFNETGLGTL